MNDILTSLLIVIPTVTLSLWWVLRPQQKASRRLRREGAAILVRDGVIEHATDEALEAFPLVIGMNTWDDLHDLLGLHFPDFPKEPLEGRVGTITQLSGTCPTYSQIAIEWQGNGARIILNRRGITLPGAADKDELETLRLINSVSPHPVWRTSSVGVVTWYNAAYAALGRRIPGPRVDLEEPFIDVPHTVATPVTTRIKIEVSDQDGPLWYEVACTPLPDGTLHQATSLDTLIRAEDAQRDFVQTLAKTFAHLSIGLAIFNRDRQLVLFNPALIDLTGLSVSFLSPRPTLDSFFHALRESRQMPEPKSYTNWRHRMSTLISAAETGTFEEVWTLESGQTFNVKGRPHPDGAIAFLIEDISAEVSLTRNFRAELEMGQSLVDTFEDALAVFSQSGVLTFSNKAYDMLWGFDGEISFADVTITDAVRLWRIKSHPNPHWEELQKSVMSTRGRHEWDLPIHIRGLFPMICRIVPIASGATVIRFSRQGAVQATQIPLQTINAE